MTNSLEFPLPETLRAPQVMIWMTNEEHRCIYCNESLREFAGDIDLLDNGWQGLVHPDDLKKVRDSQADLQSQPKFGFYRQEYRSRRPEGHYAWMLDISFPRFDGDGRFLGYIGSVVDISEQKHEEEKLKQRQLGLERQVLEVSDRERLRLSKGLQEDLCQSLNGLALKAMVLERKLRVGPTQPAAKVASEISAGLHQLAFRTKEISQSLFPALLVDEDFTLVVQDLAERTQERFGIEVACHLSLAAKAMNSERNLHLYRIIEEAVDNAVRHGKARRIKIYLDSDPEKGHRLMIWDDGVGFSEKSADRGFGINFMEYRAKLLGGRLRIQPHPKGGTLVQCRY
ncbi:MAG TPA: PAS domain-containing protein [bacterium]|nr:PAS domain-containing protein [bacterium]